MGTAFFGVTLMLLLEQVEDLRMSEELEAVVRENAVCLVVVTGPPGQSGLEKTLSYALMIKKAIVSW